MPALASRTLAPLALALALAAAAVLPPALAHTPGAAPVARQGFITLAPSGQAGSSLDVYLTDLGLPASVGDTLHMNWSVDNGSGPAIAFEIHAHGATGSTRYYNATASRLDDSWTIPDNSGFMAFFENPWGFSVNVTYDFVLFAPAADMSPLIFLLPATAGVALGWFFYLRAARGDPHLDAEVDEQPSDSGVREGEAPAPTSSPPPGR